MGDVIDIRPLNVLLIEDDDTDAERTERLLRRMTTPVVYERASTLHEGLQAMERNPPSIVLLDLHLPDAVRLDGPAILTQRYHSIPLVVLTGLEDRELALQAIELGAQDYLNKDSIALDSLERTIRYAVVRHTTQDRLRESLRRIANNNDEFDGFASAVAHDLRSPVRTARLLADRLIAGVGDAYDDPHDMAGRLDETLGRLDEVILSMLDYTGQRTNDWATDPVHLRPLVIDVVAALQADIEAAGATVEIELSGSVAVTGRSILVWRVMENLLINSIKYRHPDRDPVINVAATTRGDRVSITVADNGIGVPTEKRDVVFRMLEQLGDTPGQGLGLSVCRQIINSLDGSIWIEPNRGSGTTVTIDLPRNWVAAAAA